MGKLDIKSKIYFQNKERFADLFNFKLYGGRQQIRAEDLKPFDSAEVIVPYGDKTGQPIQRFRDNASIWASMQDDHSAYIILGIESQANIHYAMPVRNMLYDSANYAWQVRQAAASYRNNRTHDQNKDKQQNNIKLNGAEFLSGILPSGRFLNTSVSPGTKRNSTSSSKRIPVTAGWSAKAQTCSTLPQIQN